MPAFASDNGGPLTDAQVKALAAGIKPQWGSQRTSHSFSAALICRCKDNRPATRAVAPRSFARACAPVMGLTVRDGEQRRGSWSHQ